MGNSISKKQIQTFVNTAISEVLNSKVQECRSDNSFNQSMTATCKVPPIEPLADLVTGSKFFEENTACLACTQAASDQVVAAINAEMNSWAIRVGDNQTNDKKKSIIVDNLNPQFTVMKPLDYWQQYESNMEGCVGFCKSCIFTNNLQNGAMKITNSCVSNSTDTVDLTTKIQTNLVQKLKSDKDILAKVTDMLKFGGSSDDITTTVKNLISTSTINQVRQDMSSTIAQSQVMAITGSDDSSNRNSQSSVDVAINDALLKSDISIKLSNLITEKAIQAVNEKNNTIKTLGKGIAEAVCSVSNSFFTTEAAIAIVVIVIIWVVMMIGALIFFPLFNYKKVASVALKKAGIDTAIINK